MCLGFLLRSRTVAVSAGIVTVFGAVTAGVLLAASVFWAALVPVNGLPGIDEPWALTAALLIHLVLPVVALVVWLSLPGPQLEGARLGAQTLPTLVYGAIVIPYCLGTGRAVPYDFLDPGTVGVMSATLFALISFFANLAVVWGLATTRNKRIAY